MTNLLSLIVWNLLLSAALGGFVWLLCRTSVLRSRPALCHGLWLLVLLKLVTPPVVSVPLLPAISLHQHDAPPTMPGPSAIADDLAADAAPWPGAQTASSRDTFERPANLANIEPADRLPSGVAPLQLVAGLGSGELALVLLALGACVTIAAWLAALRQFFRVRRLLRGHAVAAPRLVALLRDVSRRFAPAGAVGLLVVDAPLSPVLWAEPGRSAVVLPRKLAETLDDDQLRAIFAHELAHFARRDHWTSLLAFFVATLFWWNPLAWLARRELAAAAEACCDALALERLSASRKCYAQTLLAVVDFVDPTGSSRPALGIAFARADSLRRRIETLARADVHSRLSRWSWVLLALGLAALVVLPARAHQAAAQADANADVQAQQRPADHKYYVTGIVFDKATLRPVAGAQVNILVDAEPDTKKRLLGGLSDDEGHYSVEVPLGSVRLWFPRLKPGYWVAGADAIASLATSPAQPIVTHDIAAHSGNAWPVRVTAEGGIPQDAELTISVTELDDDAKRHAWLSGKNVSFQTHLNESISKLDAGGTGAFTQCGDSGKLIVGVGGRHLEGVMAEFIVEPGFDITKIIQIVPVADTDKTSLVDASGLKATVSRAAVTLETGRPLLTFTLSRTAAAQIQAFAGRVTDKTGKPLEAVRIGAALGRLGGGSSVTDSSATTDVDGRFLLSVELSPERSKEVLQLVITKDGYAGFDSPRIDLPDKTSAAIDVGTYTLPAGRTAAVRVVDDKGEPLPGAVVEPQSDYALRRQVIRADAQGRGTLRNLPAGVVAVYASYGSLAGQSKLVVDEQANSDEVTTLRLREINAQQPQTRTMPDPPPVGSPAAEWSLVGWTDGQTRKLADYRGKVVVLDFWGLWCSACLNGLPAMKELEAHYANRSDVVFLGIHSAGAEMAQVQKLQRLKDWHLATGLDQGDDVVDGATARAYGARGWPTTVIIGRDGKVAYNNNLEKWTALRVAQEFSRVAKALNLPALKANATLDEQVARTNAVAAFRLREQIDRALADK